MIKKRKKEQESTDYTDLRRLLTLYIISKKQHI